MKTKQTFAYGIFAVVIGIAIAIISSCDNNNNNGKNDPVLCACPAGTTHEPDEKCCEETNCVCSEAEAKTQHSPNVPMFADKTATITTADTFTDTQWNAIVTAIAGKFSAGYDAGETNVKTVYEIAFGMNITIIVEKNPTGYNNYKYIRTGRTLYVRADGVNNLATDDIVLAIANSTDLTA